MKAVLRKIRISPKKANLVAGIVRGKKVTDSLALLKFMPKKAAKILYKVIHSASSNAKNDFNQIIDDLYIKKLLVTKGPTYKRSLPISRGRVHPIRKRTSHITVEVGMMDEEKKEDSSTNSEVPKQNEDKKIVDESKNTKKKEDSSTDSEVLKKAKKTTTKTNKSTKKS